MQPVTEENAIGCELSFVVITFLSIYVTFVEGFVYSTNPDSIKKINR